MDAIAILDFGSQYSQLIARRVREAHVFCELFPYDAPAEQVLALAPCGYILSGGPASVYEAGAPQIPAYILQSEMPILGICYGMQALTHALGGVVAASTQREYGLAMIEVVEALDVLPRGQHPVWMSHGDRIETPPLGFQVIAHSDHSPIAAMADPQSKRYGLQFHPEVEHTPIGREILRTFVVEVCGATPTWEPASIIHEAIQKIREQVGDHQVIAGVSGGVDSSVAAALVQQAIGDQLHCIFVNNGLLRSGEPESVVEAFTSLVGARLHAVDATTIFLEALQGIIDPEQKRRVIGERFIRVFEEQARQLGQAPFLVQGTIYPDVVESSGPDRQVAARIKTHHNVGGLPQDIEFELIEPLRYLFKDEVRAVGLELGLSRDLVFRQPFPGPGLAVRCLGAITLERLGRLREADRILREELEREGWLGSTGKIVRSENEEKLAQAFAVLLPVQSVGVMGDQRTYAETLALRAVTSEDFMTADWARLPYDLLALISSRIVNEVDGINRVVYDITSKPPATIEWE
ncbi:MAG: glutamine-hydrolyzing GMP synthase [Anaerolineales bacterium]|nr:MAG: glutamine-hydrolyzing GMP synthase [Anaerolineales bacterium]